MPGSARSTCGIRPAWPVFCASTNVALPRSPARAAPEDPEPLAIDYVVLGSRLGSSVLKRHWAQAEDPRVRDASCYFSAPAQVRRWQAFCRQTREMSPKNAAADRAVDDTRRIFALFNDHNSSDARPRAHDT